MSETSSLESYNRLLARARERFEQSPGLNAIRANTDPRFLESFLVYFCAIGAKMTEPVEDWIRRAASRTADMGHSELAAALTRHAQAESGHHLMMIADLRSLANHWNARHTPVIDADDLLDRAPGPGAIRYCEVHERNITGNTPFAQIAIEYEIEQLPLRYGSFFVARCLEVFGPSILPSLSFVTSHIELDVGHTRFNERELARLIDEFPESLAALVSAGSAALDAYAQFLSDCVNLAQQHCASGEDTTSHFVTWQLQAPHGLANVDNEAAWPGWLQEVRRLRGAVFFDEGRRPQFKTGENEYDDPDPADHFSWHILAYSKNFLVGCIRVFPLSDSDLPCLTEELLGHEDFEAMLARIGRTRRNAFEIGRWVTDHRLGAAGSLAPGVGLELAAAAGAVVRALAGQADLPIGAAIFAAGSRDRQYLALSRLGLEAVPEIGPLRSDYYNDTIRVMYCTSIHTLRPRFQRLMDAMCHVIGLDRLNAGDPSATPGLPTGPRTETHRSGEAMRTLES